ncbi:MAG TPA: CPBP family intramembrane metalloprotease, partial [Tepidisphaeraceae bacterium]|nr:CPBP family intramembrane metalloprotease [Tepidisphaeraceae bacterium]
RGYRAPEPTPQKFRFTVETRSPEGLGDDLKEPVLIDPSRPFAFPRQRPDVWVMVMLLYPIFSVLPQTLIYRVFFFHRYASLFRTRTGLIVAATLVFAVGHLMFHSWVAIALTLAGGLLFSIRYATTRSAPLSAIEHALFGQMAFTLGYGMFLYHGSVRVAGG